MRFPQLRLARRGAVQTAAFPGHGPRFVVPLADASSDPAIHEGHALFLPVRPLFAGIYVGAGYPFMDWQRSYRPIAVVRLARAHVRAKALRDQQLLEAVWQDTDTHMVVEPDAAPRHDETRAGGRGRRVVNPSIQNAARIAAATARVAAEVEDATRARLEHGDSASRGRRRRRRRAQGELSRVAS